MAALAVAAAANAQPSKRKSRRALAQSFLSRISLDGNVVREKDELNSGPEAPKVERHVSDIEEVSVSAESGRDGSTIKTTNTKPKYMHSISETAASFEKDKTRTLHSRESKSIICNKILSTPEHVMFRRSYSLTESLMTESSSSSGSVHFTKGPTRHKITCMSGSSFKLRRKLHDKR
jgi:hypothetical protein